MGSGREIERRKKMKVLALNSGSSSLKYQLYEMPEEQVLVSGGFERIGIEGSFYTIKIKGNKEEINTNLPNHAEALSILLDELVKRGIVGNLSEIKGVGHRIVQGGDYYSKSTIIDDDLINKVEELSVLAPLHNPAGLTGVKAAKELIKEGVNVAVFDTAFHQTIEEENYLYPVPYSWYKDYKVRKYGFHGTSHNFLSNRISEILGEENKIITCHIGNGASISAIKNGKCINTSMGLTPNAGVMMGTRSGDIDATIITYLMGKTGMNEKEIDNALNKQSGVLGISEKSSDLRDIEDGIANNDKRCILAHNMYVNKIVDYIARYFIELGGADAIVFTGGVGERSPLTREKVLKKLEVLGVKIDLEKNKIKAEETLITTEQSKIKVYVIPTDEELMIARDTYNLIKE